jgi:hypothetical protein
MGGVATNRCFPSPSLETMMTKTLSIRHLAVIGLAVLAGSVWANEHASKNKPMRTADKATAARTAPADVGPVRDWRQIDLNKDNLISPEEMEKWLAANPGPQRK